jgi:hypothetical protein
MAKKPSGSKKKAKGAGGNKKGKNQPVVSNKKGK